MRNRGAKSFMQSTSDLVSQTSNFMQNSNFNPNTPYSSFLQTEEVMHTGRSSITSLISMQDLNTSMSELLAKKNENLDY